MHKNKEKQTKGYNLYIVMIYLTLYDLI